MPVSRTWLVTPAFCLSLVPTAAMGQVDDHTHDKARIVYSAPQDCPDEQAFLSRVRAKTQRAWCGSWRPPPLPRPSESGTLRYLFRAPLPPQPCDEELPCQKADERCGADGLCTR